MPALQLDSLDKSTWQTFRFEQIARSIGERVEPSETDLETYVGLEHIDPESIHIKRFGTRDDVSGTKLRCYPGDVIFGRRRAYQRKAAICEFDGFCSAHSLVLRANPEVIDPKLFPFFLHSDTFMHRAVDISVGSLSPTINWKTLKTQQFLLPPKDQQAKLAELLWAADAAVEATRSLHLSLIGQKGALQRHHFEASAHPMKPLGKCAKIYTGGTPSRKKLEYWGGNIPWIKTGEIDYSVIEDTEEKITQAGLDGSSAKIVPTGSLLMAMYGQGVTRGRVGITGIEASINQACAAIEIEDATTAKHTFYFLEYKYEDIRDLAQGANQQNLNLAIVKSIGIPQPPDDVRNQTVAGFERISDSIRSVEQNSKQGKLLLKSITNQIF